uniref:Histone deacetylase 8 n=1 Tax=Eutreptiella gymnastica TaxID=73025 RepID=A0A7S4CCR0_9EUGL
MAGPPVYIYSPQAAGLCDRVLSMHRDRSLLGHALVQAYGLFQLMTVEAPVPATDSDLKAFHTAEFVDFVQQSSGACGPQRRSDLYSSDCDDDAGPAEEQKEEFGLLDDCPAVEECFPYMLQVAGGTLHACDRLAQGVCHVALHWDGGRHHATQSQAQGFCYVNDVALGVLRLLDTFERVLVIDIDAHHGDGTETAFYDTDRVLTVSTHMYGPGLYPGTGSLEDVGESEGTHYNINIPFKDGVDDATFLQVVPPVMQEAVHRFQPTAVVLVCGADALAGDRLCCMNLSLQSYQAVARQVKSWSKPTLVLGGGGYTVPNVAKCWACVSAIFCERRASATHAAAAVQYPPPGAAATPSRTDTEGLAQGTGPQCASDGTEAGAEQSQIVCSSTLKRPWINADADDAPGKRLRAEAVVPVCPERAIACAAVGSAGGYDMGLQEEDTAKLFTFQGDDLVLATDIPHHDHFDAYAPDFRLEVAPMKALKNYNDVVDITALSERLSDILQHIQPTDAADGTSGNESEGDSGSEGDSRSEGDSESKEQESAIEGDDCDADEGDRVGTNDSKGAGEGEEEGEGAGASGKDEDDGESSDEGEAEAAEDQGAQG